MLPIFFTLVSCISIQYSLLQIMQLDTNFDLEKFNHTKKKFEYQIKNFKKFTTIFHNNL